MMRALLVLFLCFNNLQATDFESAKNSIEKDYKKINLDLDQQRTEVFKAREDFQRKIALAEEKQLKEFKTSSELEDEIVSLQQELKILSREFSQQKRDFTIAEKQMIQMRRGLEAVLPREYNDVFSRAFQEQDLSLEKKDSLTFLNQFCTLQEKLLKDGFLVNETAVSAVSENGQVQDMQLISLGHAQFYLQNGESAGLVKISETSVHPEMQKVAGLSNTLKTVAAGEIAALPFDLTGGLAMKTGLEAKSILDHFKAGGIIIYPLALLGLLCLLAGLYKTVQLYTVRSEYDDKVRHLLILMDEGKNTEAQEYLASLKNPIKGLLTEAFEQHHVSRENLEEHLNENILSQLPKLDRFLTVLSVSAGAAPLLGLLGTVMGIIKTFEMIGIYGTGDANRMAGGISEALVTTEMGLIVAIPALIWHAILNRRLRTIVSNLEKAMLSFVNALALKGDKS